MTEDVTPCKEQQSRHSTSPRVVVFVLYTLWRYICDQLEYIQTGECNIFVKIRALFVAWMYSIDTILFELYFFK